MADVAGKRIGVVGGTTNERVVTELDKRRSLGLKIVAMKSRDEAFAALEGGKVDAFASDKILLIGAGMKAKDPKSLFLLPEDLSFEPYAIALPRGDAGLRLAVNAGLSKIYAEGEIASIFGKWFGPLGEPTPLMRAMFIFGVVPE
jgi:ABC-type amino acid transport substrate-binding protein